MSACNSRATPVARLVADSILSPVRTHVGRISHSRMFSKFLNSCMMWIFIYFFSFIAQALSILNFKYGYNSILPNAKYSQSVLSSGGSWFQRVMKIPWSAVYPLEHFSHLLPPRGTYSFSPEHLLQIPSSERCRPSGHSEQETFFWILKLWIWSVIESTLNKGTSFCAMHIVGFICSRSIFVVPFVQSSPKMLWKSKLSHFGRFRHLSACKSK